MTNIGMKKQIVCGCSILLALCHVSCGGEVQSGQPGPGTAETFGTETVDIFEDRQNPYAGSMYDLLAEEDVEEYLKGLGMEDVSPVCFYDLKGAPKLKLYYDRETGRGCGLEYEEMEDGTNLLGFEISGYESYQWNHYWNFHTTSCVFFPDSMISSLRYS